MKQWIIEDNSFIVAPQKNGLAKVVVTINYRRIATDGELTAEYAGALGFSAPSVDNFIIFDNLTQEIVEKWLNEGTNLEEIDADLDAQIEQKKNNPIVILGKPWN